MKKYLSIACLLLCGAFVSAQPKTSKPLTIGVIDHIRSATLKEDRILNIYLPEGYSKDSAKAWPVIYLLDGSTNEDLLHIMGIVQFRTMIGAMKPAIIVGIANKDRKRDFTFPTTVERDKKDFPTTGHSAAFIAFLEKELLPYVERQYHTGTRTLIGQSLGGLLATEILLKKTDLFDQYLIVSPSLWWDNESLLQQAPALLAKYAGKPPRVIVSVGAEGKQMEGDAQQLASLLKAQKGFTVDFLPLPEENHLTILHNSIYKCLSLLYPLPATPQ